MVCFSIGAIPPGYCLGVFAGVRVESGFKEDVPLGTLGDCVAPISGVFSVSSGELVDCKGAVGAPVAEDGGMSSLRFVPSSGFPLHATMLNSISTQTKRIIIFFKIRHLISSPAAAVTDSVSQGEKNDAPFPKKAQENVSCAKKSSLTIGAAAFFIFFAAATGTGRVAVNLLGMSLFGQPAFLGDLPAAFRR